MLPGEAVFACDVRALPGMTREGIEADLAAFLARARADDPELDATLVVEHWLAPCEIDAGPPGRAGARRRRPRRARRRPPARPRSPAAPTRRTCSCGAGIPTVPSFGPGLLTDAHRPNERISTQAILDATAIYADTARRFLDA